VRLVAPQSELFLVAARVFWAYFRPADPGYEIST